MPKPSLKCLSALAGLLLLPVSAAPAASAPPLDAKATAVERGLLPTLMVEGVTPWTLAERMRHYQVPGVSIALVQDGRIAWARGYGVLDVATKAPVTPQTLFQAASLSKPVTAMAVLRLADQGRLSLTAPVNSQLKSWRLPDGPFTNGVTLGRILSHTAGLSVGGFTGYPPGAVLPTLVETLNGRPPANNKPVRVDVEPGTSFHYSGGGYEVLQQLLVDVTGTPFAALMQAAVLGPAGMESSFFQQPPGAELAARAASGYTVDGAALPGKWHVYPELAAAGLWTTPSDLARFILAVQQSQAGTPGALLSKDMAARMLTAATAPAAGDLGLPVGNGMGLFVEHRGRGTFDHVSMEGATGSDGFRALLVASIAGGYGLVVMTNGDGGSKLAEEILRGAAEVYGWKALVAPQLRRAHPTEEQLRKLAGRYRLGSDQLITVTAGTGLLKVQPVLGDAFELHPVDGGDFVRTDPPTRFNFDTAGVVVKNLYGVQNGTRINATDTTPLQLLMAGKVTAATAAYRKLRQFDSTDPAVAELRLNDLAYELQKRAPDKALPIFELNTELYPDSANAWDSLAEAYLGVGKREDALRSYRRVLGLLPRDSHLPPEIKDSLLQNAQRQVAELQRHP
jgi:CubicO group peptidase (beta-lactamase class C family)